MVFRRFLISRAVTEKPAARLALGLDHAGFIVAMAPERVILMGKEKDYFDALVVGSGHHRPSRARGFNTEAVGN